MPNYQKYTTISSEMEDSVHIPVLLNEVLQYLDPGTKETYLDLTAGYGGHAMKVLERTQSAAAATLIDRDPNAIDYLVQQKNLHGAEIIRNDFLGACKDLRTQGRQYKLILADLGVSSPHLDNANRGFSIRNDGPLDMRMDTTQALTAKDIVNSYAEAELAGVLRDYGEEPKARRIAAAIVASRPIATTHELAEIIARAVPKRRVHGATSKVHPATKSFQAIRLAVNDELGQLRLALPIMTELLAPGGRIVVISFHSLEDRIVKQFFHEQAGDRYDAPLTELTKRPVTASVTELGFNPRARSAKLRAAAK